MLIESSTVTPCQPARLTSFSARKMRTRRGFGANQAQFAMKAEFAHGHPDQFAAGQFVFHADLGKQRHAVPHGYETLDGLQGGQFDIHVQGCLVTLERLNHLLAIGRRDDMGDE